MHYGCCVFVLLHAAARVSGYRLSAAGFILIAGYLFFYGQSGIVMYLAEQVTNPTAVLLGSTAFAMSCSLIYTILFPPHSWGAPSLTPVRVPSDDKEAASLMAFVKMASDPVADASSVVNWART